MSCYHPMIYMSHFDMSNIEDRKLYNRLHAAHLDDTKRSRYVSGVLISRELAEQEGVDLARHHALLIPCGRCIGCRLDYSRQWAERCVHEAEQFEHNYFLTLTYDDDHLPYGSKGIATLIKDEVSSFMKRLRTYMKRECGVDNIRFFACGEYGEGRGESPDIHSVFRPHYHIILFNCPLPDLNERHPIFHPELGRVKYEFRYDSNGEKLLYSPIVAKAWQSKGDNSIGQVTFESCAYVARYVVKKLYGKEGKKYEDTGIIPPFVRMSRDPGIGFNWYMTNMKHIYDFDSVMFKRGDKVVVQKPGKYCDKLFKKVNPSWYYAIKNVRHEAFYDSIDSKTYEGVDLASNNHKSERLKERSAKLLKRGF